MKLEKTSHISVMKEEAIRMLNANEGGIFLDCTLGGAGHTKAILDANKNNKVVAIDRDKNAILRAREFLKDYKDRVEFFNLRFSEISQALKDYKFNGVLADLGISTDQLKEQRGFSFNDDCMLDMRMCEDDKKSAYSIINETEYKELFAILKQGGVGREASKVANEIIKHRPIKTTKELADILKNIFCRNGKSKTHPLSLPFQAIRIAVNDEFNEIKSLLEVVPSIVCENARLVVISFHSLEDKIVTSNMRMWQKKERVLSKIELVASMVGKLNEEKDFKNNFDGEGFSKLKNIGFDDESKGVLLTKKAMIPSIEEITRNPASRSSLMRVFEFK